LGARKSEIVEVVEVWWTVGAGIG